MMSGDIEPIKDQDDFEILQKYIWGDHKDYANNLVIISDAELPLAVDYKIPLGLVKESDGVDAAKIIEKKGYDSEPSLG